MQDPGRRGRRPLRGVGPVLLGSRTLMPPSSRNRPSYLLLVADCALRSASSAHAIHAPAISINIALSFSDTRCAKRRHSAAYCRKRSASLSMTRFTFWMFQCSELQTGNSEDRSG